MFSLFGRPKPCRVMTALMDTETSWHLSKLARTSDSTYVYVTGLVSKLQKNGLVTVEPKGKKRIVNLTLKGREVANAIYELMNRLED
jgi:predicted transcriptional regulator